MEMQDIFEVIDSAYWKYYNSSSSSCIWWSYCSL